MRPVLVELETRWLLSGYVVNDSGDLPLDIDPKTGLPLLGPALTENGTITLRSAIQQVNMDGGGSIDFESAMTITPLSAYDAITAPYVTIVGPGPGTVVIDGSNISSHSYVFTLLGGHDTLQDLVVDGPGVGVPSGGGIDIHSNDNVLVGDYIGTDATGALALSNVGDGIYAYGGSGNTIGGTTSGAANVISGNGGFGLELEGESQDVVAGNFIGTNATGSAALSNAGDGIYASGGSGNTIGGTTSGAANVISGNGGGGLELEGESQDVVAGNFIGTNATGSAALPNTGFGISASGGSGNTIGGTTSGAANVISGNNAGSPGAAYPGHGLELEGESQDVVAGNFIGTNATGSAALSNAGDGIYLFGGGGNTISGTTSGAANVISGNGGFGLELEGESQDVVAGNFIGTNATGSAALSNAGDGISAGGGGGNTIGGTTSGAANVISGNGGGGLELEGESGDVVAGNFIGTIATGSIALSNAGDGIDLFSVVGDTIGGTTSGAANVISGNGGNGLDLGIPTHEISSQDVVEGNFIGTNATGSAALPNTGFGIYASRGSGDTIGGTTSGAANVISGNGGGGLDLEAESGDVVAGNFIGTNATGSIALSNAGDGIDLVRGGGNTIGGTTSGAANVISGNGGGGLDLEGESGDVVAGNFIGTIATGSAALPNTGFGISAGSGGGNTIGGTTSGAANVISGNGGPGLELGEGQDVVAGNFIGTNAGGTADLGNSSVGIWIQNFSSGNTIGGTTADAGNIIAFNAGNGVTVGLNVLDASLDNAVLENSIFSNSGLGIDVDNTAPQAAPVLTSAISGGSQTTITGTVTGAPNTIFRIEFFSNPAGTSQGETYLGFLDVVTNGSGSASFSFSPAPAVATGLNITATATDPDGNTSEFSAPATVLSGPINVTSDVSVKPGGFVYNRTTRQFTQTLTITNISGAAIAGPIELVLLNLKNATLVNQSGSTQGNPYITVLNSGSLGIGQSLTITLVFADPTLATITYTPEFLSGPIPPGD